MNTDLMGRLFVLEGNPYRIIDVRRLGADTLVYAEPTKGNACKMALRLEDVADGLVDEPAEA